MVDLSGPSGAPSAQAPRRTLLFSLLAASVLFLLPLLSVPLMAAQGEERWRSLGLRGETVLALTAVSGENGALLFAQTPSGLWRRAARDLDGAWTRIDRGLPHSTLGAPLLAAWRNVPGRPLQLYALAGRSDARQLFRTDDGGATWRSVGPAPGQSPAPAMAVLPGLGQNADTIIIATQTRVQRSVDGGATWAPGGEWPLESAEPEPVIELASEATGPDRLLALERSGRLWLSDSGGLSWHDIGGERAHTALATASYFRLGIWAATASEMLRSEDDGVSWSARPLPGADGRLFGKLAAVRALAVDPRVPETLYAALEGGTVRRLGSGDDAWQPLGAPPSARVSHLAVDPDTRTALYAATDDGVWMRAVVADQPTVTPSPAATLEPSPTPLPPTATATWTASPTPTATATETATLTPTVTDTVTATATETATATATRRPTRQPTPTETATSAPTAGPTAQPSEPPPGAPEPTNAPPPTPTPVLPR